MFQNIKEIVNVKNFFYTNTLLTSPMNDSNIELQNEKNIYILIHIIVIIIIVWLFDY